MKQLYFLFALLPFLGFGQQRFQMGGYFSSDIPNRAIMPKMSPNNGLGLKIAYRPFRSIPVSIEVKGSLGSYSDKKLPQTYIFNDSMSTTTNVTYASTLNKVMLGFKIHIGSEYKAVRGFVTPQIGLATMRTKISIADPKEPNGCEPLEKETRQKYSGAVYGAEAGAEISMSRLFNHESTENKHRLFVSATFMSGFSKFEYVNVKYMQDNSHMVMNGDGMVTDDGRDINGKFINVSNNSIHEHKIAEVYRTSFQFFGFNIGYTFNF